MDILTATHNAALSEYMAASGITQADLGAALGKSQSWVSKRLKGTRRWTLCDLNLLAKAGIPVGEFLYSRLPLGDVS